MRLTPKRISVISLTAAVYVVMTLAFPSLSYEGIQCRFSEILNLLVFINPIFAPGVVLGCFIANIFSPVNPIMDCIMGTSATFLAVFFIMKFSKGLFIASIWPTVFNMIVALEICILENTLSNPGVVAITFASVMIGEFIAVTVIGYPIIKYLMKNKYVYNLLKSL